MSRGDDEVRLGIVAYSRGFGRKTGTAWRPFAPIVRGRSWQRSKASGACRGSLNPRP